MLTVASFPAPDREHQLRPPADLWPAVAATKSARWHWASARFGAILAPPGRPFQCNGARLQQDSRCSMAKSNVAALVVSKEQISTTKTEAQINDFSQRESEFFRISPELTFPFQLGLELLVGRPTRTLRLIATTSLA